MGQVVITQAENRVEAKVAAQLRWQRIMLLIVLGYEAAGCLLGGYLLIAAPDGRLMNMPVGILHSVFRDFMTPGFILVGLGLLNGAAFVDVLLRKGAGWLLAFLALGGLVIWFIVEIVVVKEL